MMQSGILLGPVAKKLLRYPWSPKWLVAKEREDPEGWYDNVFAVSSISPLGNLALFGVMIFQFLIGVKMDPTMVLTTGKKALVIGVVSLIVPLTFSVSFVSYMRNRMGYPFSIHRLLTFIGAAQANTSFPVIACLLADLKILNSELGRLALSSAIISDLSYRILDITTTSLRINISSLMISFLAVFSCVGYVFLVIYVLRPAFVWVIRRTPEGKQVKEVYVVLIMALVILSGLASTSIGQHVLFGPFILGLAVPEGPPLGLTLINRLESFFIGLLVPLFLTNSGLRMDFSHLSLDHIIVLSSVIVFTLLAKLAATFFPAIYCHMPMKDSLALALILCSKGIVEMAIYNSWKDSQLVENEAFVTLIMSVMLVSVIMQPAVKALYDPTRKYSGYIKRTIQDTKRNSELRIIVCIHEQENVPTTIRLLQVSNPTTEDPIFVYLIHLVELLGRSAPLLISHSLWKSNSLEDSQSQHIINAFRHYERKYEGALSIQPFTAISPIVTMHDDICLLALSKRASFIIIPFHKQWAIDGTMGSTNLSIRTVNNNVLNRAPCSVGLLVDRGVLGRSTAMLLNESTYRVAMIFLGGEDDREALALARRMGENPNVQLKVVRIVAANKTGVNELQMRLDEEAVDEFKTNVSRNNERVVYTEEVVRDGEQTASIVGPMEHEHDLIVVGRRYGVYSPVTAGLTEWSECAELGVLGDMLASSDIKSPVSILVVQQQIIGSMLTS
ncbi:Cation/H+ exchanger [Macleaya cordata]|uniref:Cation/H+ exchanger n=1 Tax=Macleaya cordata TaxID=56857 RepID=A0A200R3B6_MACCD|nr:Cation/H+ exchanger [Macleaya cordata]